MAEVITQANRLLALDTPAGDDVLLIASFAGSEAISRPFRYTVKMVADVLNNKPAQVKQHELVGKAFTIGIKLSEPGTDFDTKLRFINGLCERFSKDGQDDNFAYYSAVIVPWFSFLNYSTNCRIFEDKAVPDIIQKVVSDCGYASYLKVSLTKSYTPWDYCVQYRETDFAFISRLMEHEGMYYYFEHDNGKHVMVLADAPSCYNPTPEQSTFRFAPVAGQDTTEDTIRSWSVEEEIHSGKWSTRDYHHEMPSNNLEISETSPDVADEGKKFEIYDYPGDHAKKFNKPEARLGEVRPEGEKIDRLRMQKEETPHLVVSGWSRCRAFSTGYKITVQGGEAAGSYLLTEVEHTAVQQPDYQNREDMRFAYENHFRCIKANVPYVPMQRTPKPVVYGLDTALVVDESSSGTTEEIWPDKYGRIRVCFHWDREANYTCWLRVVQSWAGRGWGQLWLPRTGDEVVVSFLQGDPDCPIAIGSVYNKNNMPIFTLPDNKTQSGILTRSSMKGSAANYNMLRFEDKKGSEEIFVQAEKDLNAVIENNETRKVGSNRTSTIHVNDDETVETGDHTLTVKKGNRTATIHADEKVTVETGNRTVTISQGNDKLTISMGNRETEVSMGGVTTKSPLGTNETDAMQVEIKGTLGIKLTCGASSIEMNPAMIKITAPMVMINS